LPASSSDGFLDARCVIVTGSRALAVNIRFQDHVTRINAVVLIDPSILGFAEEARIDVAATGHFCSADFPVIVAF